MYPFLDHDNDICDADEGLQTLAGIRTKAKALTSFAGMIRYRLPSETHAHLQRLNVEMGV